MKTLTIERTKGVEFFRDLMLVLGTTFVIALMGQIMVQLPFTPVPFCMQNNAILLAGLILGPRRAFLAVGLLLAQAAAGLPVLAGGSCGISVFFCPSAGYIWAYPVSAFIVGCILRRYSNPVPTKIFQAISAGLIFQYLIGCAWLTKFVGFPTTLWLGFAPFIVTDLVINVGVAKLGQRARSFLKI